MSTVKDAIDDLISPAKISVFQYNASILEPFLRIFHSSGPLPSFLYQELEKVIRLLLLIQNVIKTDILTEAKSTFKLMKIDLQQSKCNGREVQVDIAASLIFFKTKVSESRKSQIHNNCLKMYIGIVSKLRKRSLLQYKLTRAVSALNPVIIYYSPDLGKRKISELLVILHDSK